MPERFLILGRAGSGKTTYALEKFYSYIKTAGTGRVIFLLPTYGQAEHLKDVIIRNGPARGFVDNSIFTFSQLAREILDREPPGRLISELEKDTLLRDILEKNPPKYLTKDSWEHRGLRHALLRFIKELKEDSLYPADFKARIDMLINKGVLKSPAVKEKYKALADVYSRFQGAFDRKGLYDEDDVLNAALKRLEGDGSVLNAKEALFVDGFHSFTPVEFRMLKTLTQKIPDVYISLALDPETSDSPIFERCRDVYRRLKPLGFKEVVLDGGGRFSSSKTLAHVEKNLFAKNPSEAAVVTGDDLTIIEAANIEDEVEQMARLIYGMVSGGSRRFSDVGIVLRDIEPYYDIIETIFPKYGIPVRLYVKRPLVESPLIQTIMTLTRIFTSGWREGEDVRKTLRAHYIKSPCDGSGSSSNYNYNGPGLAAEEVDRLEREAMKRGLMTGSGDWLELARKGSFPGVREFIEKLIELEKGVSSPKPAKAFRQWFLTLIDESITLPGATDPSCKELVKKEAQALGAFLSVLESLTHIFGDKPVAFNVFVEELSYGLSATSYSLNDKRYDVVNVIDALEARQWELPVVFVGGLLEQWFPRQARENLFLKDKERWELRDSTGADLRELQKNTVEEERFLFYIALTRAKEKLVLSYPAMDSRGNRNIPSFFLRGVRKLFSRDNYSGKIFRQRTPSDLIPTPGSVLTRKDLRNFVCYRLNTPYRRGSDRETLHVLARTAYNNGLRAEDSALAEDLKVALGTPEAGDIGPHRSVIKEIIPVFKATQFRDFAQCPFLHFSRYILRLDALKLLAEEGLNPSLQGDIIHETLRRYYKYKEKDITDTFNNVFTRKTRGIRLGLNELRVKDEMLQALRALVKKDKYYREQLRLEPAYFEESFGDSRVPLLDIDNPYDKDTGTIRIKGRIDRIDVADINGERIGLILDYKYTGYDKGGFTKRRFKEIEEEGVDLQLPVYLMAARGCLNIVPIGAQLYTLKPPPERSGILGSRAKELAPSLTIKGMPCIDEEDMEAFLKHSREHICRHAGDIMSGNKDVSPRNVQRCEEGGCEFLDVCRFERWSTGKKEK